MDISEKSIWSDYNKSLYFAFDGSNDVYFFPYKEYLTEEILSLKQKDIYCVTGDDSSITIYYIKDDKPCYKRIYGNGLDVSIEKSNFKELFEEEHNNENR